MVLGHPRSDFTGVPAAWLRGRRRVRRVGGGPDCGARPFVVAVAGHLGSGPFAAAFWTGPEAARPLVVGLLALERPREDFDGARLPQRLFLFRVREDEFW